MITRWSRTQIKVYRRITEKEKKLTILTIKVGIRHNSHWEVKSAELA